MNENRATKDSASHAGPQQVLLVDPDKKAATQSSELLGELGYGTVTVPSPVEALTLLAAPSSPPFVLILFSAELLANTSLASFRPLTKAPLIAISPAFPGRGLKPAFEAGADDYLSTPLHREQTSQVLERHLGAIASGINFAEFQRLCGGDTENDQELMKKVARLVLEKTPSRLQSISDFLDANDIDSVRKTAHSLKSSAATIGAERLRRLGLDLELGATAGHRAESLRFLLRLAVAEFQSVSETLAVAFKTKR